jgi:hypothetical protein
VRLTQLQKINLDFLRTAAKEFIRDGPTAWEVPFCWASSYKPEFLAIAFTLPREPINWARTRPRKLHFRQQPVHEQLVLVCSIFLLFLHMVKEPGSWDKIIHIYLLCDE